MNVLHLQALMKVMKLHGAGYTLARIITVLIICFTQLVPTFYKKKDTQFLHLVSKPIVHVNYKGIILIS